MSRPPHSIYTERSVHNTKAGEHETDIRARHSDHSDTRPDTRTSARERTDITGIDYRACHDDDIDDDIDDDRTSDLSRARRHHTEMP